MSLNRLIVDTLIGILWTIFTILEWYLWIPTQVYRWYLTTTFAAVGSSTSDHNNSNHQPLPPKTVVIVGGNFAGLAALWKLLDEQIKIATTTTHSKNKTSKFRIVLIDQREYSEYTPGILRLFCDPTILNDLAQPLPTNTATSSTFPTILPSIHQYEFIQGQVVSIVQQDKAVTTKFRNILTYAPTGTTTGTASTTTTSTLEYDYLIVATGMTYRQQPITPTIVTNTKDNNVVDVDERTLIGRRQQWNQSHQQIQNSSRVIVLGGGAVGIELVAEIIEHDDLMNNATIKHNITLMDVAPELVMNFPRPARVYAHKWLQRHGVNVMLSQKIRSFNHNSCTLDDGTVIQADIVYVCFGSRPNSELISSCGSSSTTPPSTTKTWSLLGGNNNNRGILHTTDTLQVMVSMNNNDNDNNNADNNADNKQPKMTLLQDGCIFACGDVATPPTCREKQAFQAEMQGKVAAKNVIQLLRNDDDGSGKNKNKITPSAVLRLNRYPQDIAGHDVMPLVYILSLGKYDGVLGFNNLTIPGGILAPVAKWILEYTKVLEMRGQLLGRFIWILAEEIVMFLSRTIIPPISPLETKPIVPKKDD